MKNISLEITASSPLSLSLNIDSAQQLPITSHPVSFLQLPQAGLSTTYSMTKDDLSDGLKTWISDWQLRFPKIINTYFTDQNTFLEKNQMPKELTDMVNFPSTRPLLLARTNVKLPEKVENWWGQKDPEGFLLKINTSDLLKQIDSKIDYFRVTDKTDNYLSSFGINLHATELMDSVKLYADIIDGFGAVD